MENHVSLYTLKFGIVTILVLLGVIFPDGFEGLEVVLFIVFLILWTMSLLAFHFDVMSYHYTTPTNLTEKYIKFMGSQLITRESNQSFGRDVQMFIVFPFLSTVFGLILVAIFSNIFMNQEITIVSTSLNFIFDVIYLIGNIVYFAEVSL